MTFTTSKIIPGSHLWINVCEEGFSFASIKTDMDKNDGVGRGKTFQVNTTKNINKHSGVYDTPRMEKWYSTSSIVTNIDKK